MTLRPDGGLSRDERELEKKEREREKERREMYAWDILLAFAAGRKALLVPCFCGESSGNA